jgi:hypothetical protein
MIKGHGKTAGYRRGLAGMVVLLLIFTCGGFPEPATATHDDRILHLTLDRDRCFLGPYLAYLPDPQKKLTIEAVSSPQLSVHFIRHTGKMLNLGFNTSAYWIRFTVDISENQILQKKWLLYFGWPNNIDYATLYIPEFSGAGWSAKEVGRILPSGRDPQPSTPTAFLPSENIIHPLTFYLRVESSEPKLIPLQILTDDAYQEISRKRSLGFGIYYGIMLAMLLYNLILLVSLRELNRLYYVLYLTCMGMLFLESNGLLWEFLGFGIHLGQIFVLFFISLTFFWGNLFAKSFLITQKNALFLINY